MQPEKCCLIIFRHQLHSLVPSEWRCTRTEKSLKEIEKENMSKVSEVRVEDFSFDSIPSSRIISCKCIEYTYISFLDMARHQGYISIHLLKQNKLQFYPVTKNMYHCDILYCIALHEYLLPFAFFSFPPTLFSCFFSTSSSLYRII